MYLVKEMPLPSRLSVGKDLCALKKVSKVFINCYLYCLLGVLKRWAKQGVHSV